MTSSQHLPATPCVSQHDPPNPAPSSQRPPTPTDTQIKRGEATFYNFIKKLEVCRNFDRSLLKPIGQKKSELTSVTTLCCPNEAEDLFEIKRACNVDHNVNSRPKSIDNLSFSNTDGVKNSYNFAQFEALLREDHWLKGQRIASQRTAEIGSDRMIQRTETSTPLINTKLKLPFEELTSDGSKPSQTKKSSFWQQKPNIYGGFQKTRSKSAGCSRVVPDSRKRSHRQQPQKLQASLPQLDRKQQSRISTISPICFNNSFEIERILSDDENKINIGNCIQIAQSTQEDGLIEEDEGRVETIVFRKRNEEEEEEDNGEPSGPMMLVASGLSAVAMTGFFVLKGLRRILW